MVPANCATRDKSRRRDEEVAQTPQCTQAFTSMFTCKVVYVFKSHLTAALGPWLVVNWRPRNRRRLEAERARGRTWKGSQAQPQLATGCAQGQHVTVDNCHSPIRSRHRGVWHMPLWPHACALSAGATYVCAGTPAARVTCRRHEKTADTVLGMTRHDIMQKIYSGL